MSMVEKNLDIVLMGNYLLKDISIAGTGKRVWMEVSIARECLPKYPMRVENYAMLQGAKYLPRANLENAKFRLRESSFPEEDIEMGYDPSYEDVGMYQYFDSFELLCEFLGGKGIQFSDFIDGKKDENYPL